MRKNYKFFVKMVNYYDLKIEKYNKLIKSKSSDTLIYFLLISIISERFILLLIPDSQVVKDYEGIFKSGTKVLTLYNKIQTS